MSRFLTENKRVAVKVQKLTPESESMILEEYRILRDYTSHPNLPDFYGIYRRRSGKKTEYDQIWFVMEVRNEKSNERNELILTRDPLVPNPYLCYRVRRRCYSALNRLYRVRASISRYHYTCKAPLL